MGIGKKELMQDYYLDEFLALTHEWATLHGAPAVEEEVVTTPEAFFAGVAGQRYE